MIRRTFVFLTTILMLALSQAAFCLEGKVVGVHDGDTITVLDASKTQHKIRLAQIDAPELDQEWGQNSKKALSDIVYGRFVHVEVDNVDQYGREVGTVFVDDVNANKEQVINGNAWVYVRYARDPNLPKLEKKARSEGLGLWSTGNATPPWDHRHNK